MVWTRDSLREMIRERLGPRRVIVVSNREPVMHSYTAKGIRALTPASGMVAALSPVMTASGGTWIAAGSGDADREKVDAKDHFGVPPDDPRYVLRRVWLTKEEEDAYYYGYANEGLWPLCHIVHVRPAFRKPQWDAYVRVNARFADVVCEELAGDPGLVFIQDYHFALLARMIRDRRPDVVLAQFWHIPWPNPETFRVCPQGEEILWGLLGNDIMGFHIRYHGMNFLDSADRFLEVRVDRERMSVFKGGRETQVRAYPISIDADEVGRVADSPETAAAVRHIRRDNLLKGKILVVGVERIDYTKGILERFQAVDRLLDLHPEYRGRLVFIQLGPLSRIRIRRYQEYNDRIYKAMIEINDRWKDRDWVPIQLRKRHLEPDEVVAYLRAADVCVVSAIHDGMNLVAKEFVAARSDERGMLVLSKFTGSARELESALLVHPYDIDGMAEALRRAIEMEDGERTRRMRKMREVILERNVYRWAGKILRDMMRLG